MGSIGGRVRKVLAGSVGVFLIGLVGCTFFQSKGPEIANWEPVLSPDETMIAFESSGEKGFEIFVRYVEGGEIRQLTDNEVDDWSPSWSPASDRLVFASNREKNVDLFVIDLSSLVIQRLTTHEGDDVNPYWGANDQVFFNSNRSGAWEIYSIDPNTQDLTKITESSETE
jgi:TolB protein